MELTMIDPRLSSSKTLQATNVASFYVKCLKVTLTDLYWP